MTDDVEALVARGDELYAQFLAAYGSQLIAEVTFAEVVPYCPEWWTARGVIAERRDAAGWWHRGYVEVCDRMRTSGEIDALCDMAEGHQRHYLDMLDNHRAWERTVESRWRHEGEWLASVVDLHRPHPSVAWTLGLIESMPKKGA